MSGAVTRLNAALKGYYTPGSDCAATTLLTAHGGRDLRAHRGNDQMVYSVTPDS